MHLEVPITFFGNQFGGGTRPFCGRPLSVRGPLKEGPQAQVLLGLCCSLLFAGGIESMAITEVFGGRYI